MFTGLVECIGTIDAAVPLDATAAGGGGFSLALRPPASDFLADVKLGDSIAVNGTCLTVTELVAESSAAVAFKVGVSPETLRKTNLGALRPGDAVNLEKAVSGASRFGGHFVQGHVDATVRIAANTPDPPNSRLITFSVPREGEDGAAEDLLKYIVPKGYVCLDGVSLTVVDVDRASRQFRIMMIPYTYDHVTLGKKLVGAAVNIEVDQFGKYVESVVAHQLADASSGLSELVARAVERCVGEKVGGGGKR